MGFFDIFRNKGTATKVVLPDNGTASWNSRDYNNFAKEAYLKCVISYRCINEIARAVSSVPWSVYTLSKSGKRERVIGHPINKILKRANPTHGFASFQNSATAFLALDGNSYIERITPDFGPNSDIPSELWTHRPDTIRQVFDTNTKQLIGYEKHLNGDTKNFWPIDRITMRSDLLHLKLFHPINDFEGASPVESTSREIDTYNEATEWNKKLLENEARPGMLFKFKTRLGDQQFERFKKQLNDNYSGGKNAGKNLILEGDGDAAPYGWNMHEMDFTEGGREKARGIAMGFGVPSQVIGIIGESTFSNYERAELAFWEKTVIFYLSYLKDEYNNWFFGSSEDLFVDYDLDNIPALSLRRKTLWDNVQKSNFITINEKREMVGMESIEGGDVILVPNHLDHMENIGNETGGTQIVVSEDSNDDGDSDEGGDGDEN